MLRPTKHARSVVYNGERNADAALLRGRRSVRRAIRLVHEENTIRKFTCRIGRTGASRFGTEAMRSYADEDSASSAGLSTVSKNVRRFAGFGGRRASARGTGACGPDLAR